MEQAIAIEKFEDEYCGVLSALECIEMHLSEWGYPVMAGELPDRTEALHELLFGLRMDGVAQVSIIGQLAKELVNEIIYGHPDDVRKQIAAIRTAIEEG